MKSFPVFPDREQKCREIFQEEDCARKYTTPHISSFQGVFTASSSVLKFCSSTLVAYITFSGVCPRLGEAQILFLSIVAYLHILNYLLHL